MADDLLYQCAARLVELAADALDAPPERQYVSAVEPTDNCAHVTAWVRELGQSTLGVARGRQQPGMPTMQTGQATARFLVQVARECYPVFDEDGNLAAPADIDSAAELALTDRMDVWTALRAAAADGSMFADLLAHGHDGVEVGTPGSISPQSGGGLVGSRFEVYVHLLRHEPSGS